MFTPITHEFVGTERMFMPQGYSPYEISAIDYADSTAIMFNGDAVTIEAAFTRDYLPPDAPKLFYARSHRTGKATHVTADEIKLELPFEINQPRPMVSGNRAGLTFEQMFETPSGPILEALNDLVNRRAERPWVLDAMMQQTQDALSAMRSQA